jgi:hypothetical protein
MRIAMFKKMAIIARIFLISSSCLKNQAIAEGDSEFILNILNIQMKKNSKRLLAKILANIEQHV